MNAKNKITWNSSFTQKTFHDLGMGDAGRLWNLKEGDFECTYTKIKEISSSGGKNFYSTVYMKINKSKYRLKRASGKYFQKLKHEMEIISVLPDLHITPPIIIAFSMNDKINSGLTYLTPDEQQEYFKGMEDNVKSNVLDPESQDAYIMSIDNDLNEVVEDKSVNLPDNNPYTEKEFDDILESYTPD